jgi:hypothetical protein
MTHRRADINSFFNDRHKVRKNDTTSVKFSTEKMTQRRADVVSFFNTDIKSVKNDTMSGRH